MKRSTQKIILIAALSIAVGFIAGKFLFKAHTANEDMAMPNTAPEAHTSTWTCSMHPSIRSNEPGNCPICDMKLIPVENDSHQSHKDHAAKTWTCSMHPSVRSNEPGNCPICGMKLIPVEEEAVEDNESLSIRMSPTALRLAEVETTVAHSGIAEKTLQLNGKVQADERRVYTQTSHIPGRIERLVVNFTGEYISKGQVMAYVYSPELVTAQEELLEAKKIEHVQPALLQASREKLGNWKLTDRQINNVLSSNRVTEQFPILANLSGYVTEKMVNLGDHVRMGQPIYEVANLSQVWVLFDIYESDMQWVKRGDRITYTVSSLPGVMFSGVVRYIDPIINPQTRVAKARIEAPNQGLKLRPEMFASGTLSSRIRGGASVTVPKTAVMWTGKRSVVYVKQREDQDGALFQMRQVILGADLGDAFIITSGLRNGEEVATRGAFSIDAAAQLANKPSMMSMGEQ